MTSAMIKLNLMDTQRDEIAEAIDDPATSERAKIKLLAIRLHCLDMPHGQIAAALNISNDTVTIYLKAFRKGGVAELIENRNFRPTSSVEAFLDDITRSLADMDDVKLKTPRFEIRSDAEVAEVAEVPEPSYRSKRRRKSTPRKPSQIQHGCSADLLMSISQNSGPPAFQPLQSAKWGYARICGRPRLCLFPARLLGDGRPAGAGPPPRAGARGTQAARKIGRMCRASRLFVIFEAISVSLAARASV